MTLRAVPPSFVVDMLSVTVRPYAELLAMCKAVEPSGWVYFVSQTVNEKTYIKIGYAKDMLARWAVYRTDNIGALLAMIVPGSLALERALHIRFYELRERDSWFRLDGELRDLIADFGATSANTCPGHDILQEAWLQ